MTATGLSGREAGALDVLTVERNGINTITEPERKGRPRNLFWPWFAANVSVFGVSYGSFLLGFGISFAQAIIIGIIGIVISFSFVGVIAIAGKRGSASTLVMSRAMFGVRGNRVPAVLSWILTVGWETVLASLAVLATATVFTALGWGGGVLTQVLALVVVAVLIIGAGIIGFDLIMRLQKWITIVTGTLTALYLIIAAPQIDLDAVAALPAGETPAVIGGLVFILTGFGLGWVNAAADYSRYLPRSASGRGVVGWTTLGASLAPVLLLVFGLMLAGSSADLSAAIGADPIGALAELLPVWFLVLFVLVAVLGLVGGAVMDIYSSGLSLLAAGVNIPRWAAAALDGVLLLAGSIYVVFFATDFIGPFQGFLITLGVPIAAWAGIFMADIMMRRADYAEDELYDPAGRYGDVRWLPLSLLALGTFVGWGTVTNGFADWLSWQGYLLEPLGLGGREGQWAFANLGVLFSLLIGFLGTFLLGRSAVRRQESRHESRPLGHR